MQHTHQLIKLFNDKVRCGWYSALEAISKCNSLESAVTYAYIRGDCVYRTKTIAGEKVPWTDADFINYANANPDTRFDFGDINVLL